VKILSASNDKMTASVIAHSTEFDVAILKLTKRKMLPKLTPIPLGSSRRAKLGDHVCAAGYPFGKAPIFTSGTITCVEYFNGKRRSNDIVTDAPIHAGNSGGPLLDLVSGNVIGMIWANPKTCGGRVTSMGLAIPIDDVKIVVERMLAEPRTDNVGT